MRFFLYIAGISLLFAKCTEGDEGLNNEQLIFTNSFQIRIPSYEYTDPVNGETYYFRGDSSYSVTSPDTLSPSPVFIWDDLNFSILSIGIFTNPVIVRGGEIKNTDDLCWQWHSGLATEKEDTIQFSEGKDVIMGSIDYNSDATPLNTGEYYWAIWGWGTSGTRILYSSMPFKFYVRNTYINNE